MLSTLRQTVINQLYRRCRLCATIAAQNDIAPPPPPPSEAQRVATTKNVLGVTLPPPPPPPPPPVVRSTSSSAACPQSVKSLDSHVTVPPPPPPTVATNSTLHPEDADHLIQLLRTEGVRAGLSRRWGHVELMLEEGRFTCAQIADIFEQCIDLPSIDGGAFQASSRVGIVAQGEYELPLSTRLVQLFSNFVCERIPELSSRELVTFVVALTSQSLPVDEFWLFMMAKRVQDTASSFTAAQIVTLAKQYAKKDLEDDEFFGALAARVLEEGVHEFGIERLAEFLLACSKLRYLHDELCRAAFPLFEDPSAIAALSADTICVVISAAAMLDQQNFKLQACCRRLVVSPVEFRLALSSVDYLMALSLASVSLRHPAMAKLFLPQLLGQMSHALPARRLHGRRDRLNFGRIHRRVVVLGLSAAFGVPHPAVWSTARLYELRTVLDGIEQRLGGGEKARRSSYEPASSSFHLEVASVLRLTGVEHKLEHRQHPFCLDLVVFPLSKPQAFFASEERADSSQLAAVASAWDESSDVLARGLRGRTTL